MLPHAFRHRQDGKAMGMDDDSFLDLLETSGSYDLDELDVNKILGTATPSGKGKDFGGKGRGAGPPPAGKKRDVVVPTAAAAATSAIHAVKESAVEIKVRMEISSEV